MLKILDIQFPIPSLTVDRFLFYILNIMSITFTKLCSIILEEHFGSAAQNIGSVLMRKGALTLAGIVFLGKLPVCKVQKALKIMLQHDLVTFEIPPEQTDHLYKIHSDRIYVLLRYSRYIALINSEMGNDCGSVIQEVFLAGEVTLTKLLYIFGHKLFKSPNSIESSELHARLKSMYEHFVSLVEKRYLTHGDRMELDPNQLLTQNQQKAQDFIIPAINLASICSKILNNDNELSGEPDAEVFWRVNIVVFNEQLRNHVIVSALNLKFRPFVDPRIFEVILNKGLKNEPWSEMTSPVSVYEIRDVLNKKDTGNVNMSVKDIFEHLQIVEDDPMEIIYKTSDMHGGVYSLSVKIIFNHLMWQTVERIITERHGYEAARIFRLIKTKKFIEQDSIHELGMIPAKEAKHITYTLVENNFIAMKEVRKSYAVSAATNKIIYLFYIEINHVVYALLESCYKAIMNCKLRTDSEKEKHSRLLVKEERINRILENMSNQNCSEEQVQEVEEMITPPERAVLTKVQGQTDKLGKGIHHIDDTIFILEMYMFYDSIGRLPIKSKRK